jgi:hypothetical protein
VTLELLIQGKNKITSEHGIHVSHSGMHLFPLVFATVVFHPVTGKLYGVSKFKVITGIIGEKNMI